MLSHSPKCRPDPVLLPESFCIPLRRRPKAVSPEPIIRPYSLIIKYSTAHPKRQVGFQNFSHLSVTAKSDLSSCLPHLYTPLPLPLGEVSRSDGEGKLHPRHPLHFRDYESITRSFVGSGLVPFRLQALSLSASNSDLSSCYAVANGKLKMENGK